MHSRQPHYLYSRSLTRPTNHVAVGWQSKRPHVRALSCHRVGRRHALPSPGPFGILSSLLRQPSEDDIAEDQLFALLSQEAEADTPTARQLVRKLVNSDMHQIEVRCKGMMVLCRRKSINCASHYGG